ncbi:MAG: hypothetical protein LBC87_03780 [Fibromonadaceae bacterium]|jgi:hypothetical protein|nr:hypothetical protein [Fibromonadaceae bacterium]
MRKVVKITLLAASTMLAISFILGCGIRDDEEKWCVGEFPDSAITKELKACYKIYPKSEYYWAQSELACRSFGVLNPNVKVSDPPKNRSECPGGYDDGTKKSK